MARLALVSRNPVMSMGLSAADHEIEEVRPIALIEWLEAGNDADFDALVLDLGSASKALQTVGDLRAAGRWTPILLVASSNEGWDTPELLALPGVDLLTLPIDSNRLEAATKAVLRHPSAPPSRPPTLEPQVPASLIEDVEVPSTVHEPDFLLHEQHPELPESADDQPLETSPTVEASPQLAAESAQSDSSASRPVAPISLADRLTSYPQAAPQVVEPIPVRDIEVAQVPLSKNDEVRPEAKKSRRAKRTAQPSRRDIPSHSAFPSARESQGKQKVTQGKSAPVEPTSRQNRRTTEWLGEQAPVELIEALLKSVDRLYTLGETAQVVVEDAVKTAGADSGALLVPDGGAWRVAGGLRLRPLEYRYQLTMDSWLVERVSAAGKGVLIEDSDVARRHLRGAPLASRTHLLAVPLPGVRAILLLSRDQDPPFNEVVLGELAHLANEADPLIQRAVDTRSLARELSRHVDPIEVPRD